MLKKIGLLTIIMSMLCLIEAADAFRLSRTHDGDYHEIADQLMALRSTRAPIKVLDLSNTRFLSLEEVMNVLQHVTPVQQAQMKELRMSGIYSGDFPEKEEHQTICDTIARFEELERLDLSHNWLHLDRLDISEYGGLINDVSPHLKALRFTHNHIGGTDPFASKFYGVLITVVENPDSALECVDLSSNESNAESYIQSLIKKTLLTQSKLRVLNFAHNHLTLDDTPAWVNLLVSTKNKDFVFVDLTHNLVSETKMNDFVKNYRAKVLIAPQENWPVIRLNGHNAAGVYSSGVVVVGGATSLRALARVCETGKSDWWWESSPEMAMVFYNEAFLLQTEYLICEAEKRVQGWPEIVLDNIDTLRPEADDLGKAGAINDVWRLRFDVPKIERRAKLIVHSRMINNPIDNAYKKRFFKTLECIERKSRMIFAANQLSMDNVAALPTVDAILDKSLSSLFI